MAHEIADQVHYIPMKEIFSDDSFNCRGKIAPIDVVDLARSIEDNGLQQPIVVQPYTKGDYKYRIISGHRRHAAHIVCKMDKIKAIINPVVDELTARKLNLEENLKRKDLNIIQEANAIKHFFDSGWNEDMIARQIGMSRGWVQVRLMLLKLQPDIQIVAASGFLTQENIRQLYAIKDPEQRYAAVRAMQDAKLKGEKPIKIPKTKKQLITKKERNKEEIFAMMEIIIDAVGGCFATRFGAWCAGEISDIELYKEIQQYAEENGKDFIIPSEIVRTMISS